MSDDPERSFSAARDMITYRRNQLSDDIIEACACLRSWYGPPKKEDEMFDKEEAILEQFRQVQHLTEQVVNEDEGPEDSWLRPRGPRSENLLPRQLVIVYNHQSLPETPSHTSKSASWP